MTKRRKNRYQDYLATNTQFSTERFCKVCEDVVHWTKYTAELNMCLKCYRELVLEPEWTVQPDGTKQKKTPKDAPTMEEALAAMDKIQKRQERRRRKK